MFVLCLAGFGNRFTKVGINIPKYLLPAKSNVPLLRKIVEELKIPNSEKLMLILNDRHKDYYLEVKKALQNTNTDFYLHYVEDTLGQAETAKIASEKTIANFPMFAHSPIIFHNGDTLLFNRDMSEFFYALKNADGLIDTFYNNATNYSYVSYLNDTIIAMEEKNVISDHASTGLYGFKSPEYYLQSYADTVFSGEKYISRVYDHIIKNDALILDRYSKKIDDTTVLGTPEQYEHYMKQQC